MGRLEPECQEKRRSKEAGKRSVSLWAEGGRRWLGAQRAWPSAYIDAPDRHLASDDALDTVARPSRLVMPQRGSGLATESHQERITCGFVARQSPDPVARPAVAPIHGPPRPVAAALLFFLL